MSNIPIKKVITERDSFLDENKQKLKRSVFDPRAFHHRSPMVWSAEDWLKLGDATDGNCGILIYKASRDNINYCSSPDINHVVRQELVETTDHVTEPLTLPALFFIALLMITTKKEYFMTENSGREACQSLKLSLRSVLFLNLLLEG